MPTIAELRKQVEGLDEARRAVVLRIFSITETEGFNEVPELLRPKVARWCSAVDVSSSAWRRAERQQVIVVSGLWTFVTACFNVLRACRPVVCDSSSTPAGPDDVVAACEGPGRCDFCEPEKFTCAEPFGRILGKHCLTAGNVFKGSSLHGLVIWKRHHPLQLTTEEVLDGFETADVWLDRASKCYAQQHGGDSCPVLWWNIFGSAGASQIHPHMQIILLDNPVAFAALLRDQGDRYRREIGGDLCLDIVQAHRHLGLALDLGKIQCWASLTPPIKGGELCALGSSGEALDETPPLASVALAVHAMLCALRRVGAVSTSLVAMLVRVDGREAWLVRCLNRGAMTEGSNDAGSVELTGQSMVAMDPYALIGALQAEIDAIDSGVADGVPHKGHGGAAF